MKEQEEMKRVEKDTKKNNLINSKLKKKEGKDKRITKFI
jgi:hypothetical protein